MSTDLSDLDIEFIGGSEEIEEQGKEAKEENKKLFVPFVSRRKYATFAKWTEEEPSLILRFLDDDRRAGDTHKNFWLGIMEHKFVQPVVKPKDFPENARWPESGVTVTCRKDKAFAPHFPEGCYVCKEKLPRAKSSFDKSGKFAAPTQTVYARAAVREYIRDEENPKKILGIRDVLDEYAIPGNDGKDSGKHVWLPRVVLIAQARSTFFGPFAAVLRDREEEGDDYTCLAGDWKVTRIAFGTDTAFTFKEVKGSTELPPPDGTATEQFPHLDTRNPKVREYYEQELGWSLRKMVTERAEEEHLQRYFIPGGWAKLEKAKEEGSSDEESVSAAPPKAEAPKTPEKPAAAPSGGIEDDDDEGAANPVQDRLAQYRTTYQDKLGAGQAPPRERTPSKIEDEELEQV